MAGVARVEPQRARGNPAWLRLRDEARDARRAEDRLLCEMIGPSRVKRSVFEDDGLLEDDYGEESFP